MLAFPDIRRIEQIVEEKIKNLPTRDEFYTMMDKLLGELKTNRQEQTFISNSLDNHEERILTLEKIN